MRNLCFIISALLFLASCEHKELTVEDYTFSVCYSPTDTLVSVGDSIDLQLSIEDYLKDEEISISCRVNNSIEEKVFVEGVALEDGYLFSPTSFSTLNLSYTPLKRGRNVILLHFANSFYSKEVRIIVTAMEQVTYDYDYKDYEVEVITNEGN